MPGADPPRRPPIPGLPGRALSRLYALAITRINRRFDRGKGVVRFDRPVISIGNLSVGGTGKTPMVRHIVRLLLDAGHQPCIAMRGYKGGDGSDEAAAYAREFPNIQIVAQADRTDGLMHLFAHEFEQNESQEESSAPFDAAIDCIVLDDGFQHRQIARDLDIVLIDATRSPFDDRLLPAGWLREPVASLSRASLVVLTHAEIADPPAIAELDRAIAAIRGGQGIDAATRHAWSSLSILDPSGDSTQPTTWLRRRRIFAACAIGNPAPFLTAATSASGTPLAGTLILRDHDPFAPATVLRLIREAQQSQADTILITDKDWSKLRTVAPNQWPCPIARPQLTLTFDRGQSVLDTALLKTVGDGAPD